MAENKKSSKGARKGGKKVVKAKSSSVKPKSKPAPKVKRPGRKAPARPAARAAAPAPRPQKGNVARTASPAPRPSARSVASRSVQRSVPNTAMSPTRQMAQRFHAARRSSSAAMAGGALAASRTRTARRPCPCGQKRNRAGAAPRPMGRSRTGTAVAGIAGGMAMARRMPARPMMRSRPSMSQRRMPSRSPSFNPRVSRRQFLQTAGAGAAALGAATLGFGGVSSATILPPPTGTLCFGSFGGFTDAVLDDLGPYKTQVIQHFGYNINCGNDNLTSICIPYYCFDIFTNPAYVSGAPKTDFGLSFLDTFFYGMDPFLPVQVPLPYPLPSLNGSQVYSLIAAYITFVLTRYDGPGATPVADESQIPYPSELEGTDPSFGALDSVADKVVFEASHPLANLNPFDPNAHKFNIAGYFFKGRGVWKGDKLKRPLIVHMNGITEYIASKTAIAGGNRKYVKAFVDRGFDVLFIDKPGHGWSGGFVGSVTADMFLGADGVLEQLEQKELVDDIHSVPIVLSGHSLGAIYNQVIMSENLSGNYGFDFKASIDVEGLPAGLKFTSSGLLRLLSGLRALIKPVDGPKSIFDIVAPYIAPFFPPGVPLLPYPLAPYLADFPVPAVSEYVSKLPDWSGLMAVTTTQNYQTPAGAVEAYNIATGLKDVLMFSGPHAYAFAPPNAEILAGEAIRFATEAVLLDAKPNDPSTTTVEEVVCSSPHVKTDITPQPALGEPDAKFNQKVAKQAKEIFDAFNGSQ